MNRHDFFDLDQRLRWLGFLNWILPVGAFTYEQTEILFNSIVDVFGVSKEKVCNIRVLSNYQMAIVKLYKFSKQ
jgi:hypothetical protein